MCETILHRHMEYVACTLIITNHCTHQDLQVGMYDLCFTVTLSPPFMLLLKTVCYSILQKNICPVYQSLSKLFCPCGILQTTECSLQFSNILQIELFAAHYFYMHATFQAQHTSTISHPELILICRSKIFKLFLFVD